MINLRLCPSLIKFLDVLLKNSHTNASLMSVVQCEFDYVIDTFLKFKISNIYFQSRVSLQFLFHINPIQQYFNFFLNPVR